MLCVSACSARSSKPSEPTIGQYNRQQATCTLVKDRLNPMVIEWDATSKTSLEQLSKQGPIVVSYSVGDDEECGVMKVLDDCKAGGVESYKLALGTPTRESLSVLDANELRAKLPLATTVLQGSLAEGRALELTYVSVGQLTLTKMPTSLIGKCEGATHLVRSLTTGAYSLDVQSAFAASGGIEIGGVGVGAGNQSTRKRLRQAGNIDA